MKKLTLFLMLLSTTLLTLTLMQTANATVSSVSPTITVRGLIDNHSGERIEYDIVFFSSSDVNTKEIYYTNRTLTVLAPEDYPTTFSAGHGDGWSGYYPVCNFTLTPNPKTGNAKLTVTAAPGQQPFQCSLTGSIKTGDLVLHLTKTP